MKCLPGILLTVFVALVTFRPATAQADLAPAGTVLKAAADLGIPVFDGVSIQTPLPVFEPATQMHTVGVGTIKFDTLHSPITGKILGAGTFSVTDMKFSNRNVYTSGVESSGNLRGHLSFTAIPVKRGTVVTLSGAKIHLNMQGTGNVVIIDPLDSRTWTVAPAFLTAKPEFTFRELSVNVADDPMELGGRINSGNLNITAIGIHRTRRLTRNFKLPYAADYFREIISPEQLATLKTYVEEATQSPSGEIRGFAGHIVDKQTPALRAYIVRGLRNPRTGISRLSFSGAALMRGTSATLYVNDEYELQTGPNFPNRLSIYGYLIGF